MGKNKNAKFVEIKLLGKKLIITIEKIIFKKVFSSNINREDLFSLKIFYLYLGSKIDMALGLLWSLFIYFNFSSFSKW